MTITAADLVADPRHQIHEIHEIGPGQFSVHAKGCIRP